MNFKLGIQTSATLKIDLKGILISFSYHTKIINRANKKWSKLRCIWSVSISFILVWIRVSKGQDDPLSLCPFVGFEVVPII